MNNDIIYIIGKTDLKFPSEISKDSRIVFLEKELDGYVNQFSLIEKFQENQSYLREKWLKFQGNVFSKLKPYIDNDEDYRYLMSNIFFEASPNKTDTVYLFFKLYILINYIKEENIKNVYLINVNELITNFFNSNIKSFPFQIKEINIKESKTLSLSFLKETLKKKTIPSLFFSLKKEYQKKKQKIVPKKKQSRRVVLSYYYSGGQTYNKQFKSKYFDNVSTLINDSFEWLFLYQGDRLKIQEENKILEANLNSFGFLDAYFSYTDFKIVTKKFLKVKRKLDSILLKNLFVFEGIDYLGLTKNEWLKSISISLIDLLIFEKKISNFFSTNPQIDELIYLLEFQPWEQMLNKVAQEHSVVTKGVIHSIVRPNVMNYYHPKSIHSYLYNPSLIGVNSDFSKSLLLQNGFDQKQLLEIEAHRFNYFKENTSKNTDKKFKLKKSILIITSIIMSETKELLEFFALSNVKFEKVFIKEHPLFPVSSIIKSFTKGFPSYEILKGSVEDAFSYSDIVYTANGSSVLLESVVNNKQTISLISLTSLPIPAVTKATNLYFVKDVDSLKNVLNKLSNNFKSFTSGETIDKYLYIDKELKLWRNFLNK